MQSKQPSVKMMSCVCRNGSEFYANKVKKTNMHSCLFSIVSSAGADDPGREQV